MADLRTLAPMPRADLSSPQARRAYTRRNCPVYAALKPLHQRAQRDPTWHFAMYGTLADGRTVEIVAHAGATQSVAAWVNGEREHAKGLHPHAPFHVCIYPAGVDPRSIEAMPVYPGIEDRMLLEAFMRGAGFI